MKGLFANRTPLFHLGVLLFFAVFGIFFSSTLQMIIMSVSDKTAGTDTADLLAKPFGAIHAAQSLSSVFSILAPALCTAYLCSGSPKKYLHVEKLKNLRMLLLVLLMAFLIAPAIELAGYLNSKMQLPESMSAIERWMRYMEDYAKEITAKLLSEKGVPAFLANIMVIAVAAAISEELFFRGALLSIVGRMSKNHHAAIWIVAFVFSAIHLQFYGFIPRMLLGAYLGYLLYWSKSIWLPVFAHFCNNAMAIAGSSVNALKDKPVFAEEIKPESVATTGFLAIIGLVLFALCVKKIKAME